MHTCFQGPVGRGFQSHTGSFLWSLNSYTKVVHGGRGPYGVDWITEYENGTYSHVAEPRHATIAITETSIQRMKVACPTTSNLFHFAGLKILLMIHARIVRN